MITIAGLTNFSLAQVSNSSAMFSRSTSPVAPPGALDAAHRSVQLLCDQNLVIAALPELPCLVTNGCDIRVIISFLSVILNAYHDHCDDHEWWWLLLSLSSIITYQLLAINHCYYHYHDYDHDYDHDANSHGNCCIDLTSLVVSPPLKNMKFSWDDDIPNWMEKKNMFQTTNQLRVPILLDLTLSNLIIIPNDRPVWRARDLSLRLQARLTDGWRLDAEEQCTWPPQKGGEWWWVRNSPIPINTIRNH